MGMIYLAIKIYSALTMVFIFNILTQLKFEFITALTHLGLFKPSPDVQFVRDYLNNYVFIVDAHSPSLLPHSLPRFLYPYSLSISLFPAQNSSAGGGTSNGGDGNMSNDCEDSSCSGSEATCASAC